MKNYRVLLEFLKSQVYAYAFCMPINMGLQQRHLVMSSKLAQLEMKKRIQFYYI